MQQRSVHEVAADRWPDILSALGILNAQQLTGRHCPCPMCGGKDRFRFDDKDGRGTWFCSYCGAGNGVDLVLRMKGWDFKTGARQIEQIAGFPPRDAKPKQPDETEKIERLRRIWAEAKPLQEGDEAMRYLAGRGLALSAPPASLRLHPGLRYYDDETPREVFPVMLARVVSPDGTGLTLHRTYLQNGNKAPVRSAKKLMPGKIVHGGAIRLAPANDWLGIAEGIETALAATQLFSCPVWSVVSAHGIESFEPPPHIKQLTIFADNDESFTGQAVAYAAAHRLSQRGLKCEVCTPPLIGDWLDVLVQR